MQPKVSQKHPQNFKELCTAVQQAWDELGEDTIDNLVESFDIRLQNCINIRGLMSSVPHAIDVK